LKLPPRRSSTCAVVVISSGLTANRAVLVTVGRPAADAVLVTPVRSCTGH